MQQATSNQSTSNPPTSNPPSLLITVPFSPQAPFAKWDPLHEEACEEMSLIMVDRFLRGTSLSLNEAEVEVQKLIAWETDEGYGNDVNISQLGSIAEEYYGHRARVIENVTSDMIKSELAAGHPVIVPAAGRDLRNPFFSGDGPWYHMLVVTGYTRDGFITNDPGTKRGEKYWYPTERLMNAIHDWTGVKEEIREGARRVLVVE
jgi:hypothetical protein